MVSVIGIEVQAAARENARENVACAGDPLPVFTANPDREINFSHVLKPAVVPSAAAQAVKTTGPEPNHLSFSGCCKRKLYQTDFNSKP